MAPVDSTCISEDTALSAIRGSNMHFGLSGSFPKNMTEFEVRFAPQLFCHILGYLWSNY